MDQHSAKLIEQIDQSKLGNYIEYFHELRPRNKRDIFRRAVFAFASVHTTWRNNVRIFEALRDLEWCGNRSLLGAKLRTCRAGLHVIRERALHEFSEAFWADANWFLKDPNEQWLEYRDRLEARIFGLGRAKTAFFIEMVYFEAAKLSCFDVHMLRAFQLSPHATKVQFKSAERQWIESCEARNLPPVAARWMYWDAVQRQPNSRYWAYVLEHRNEKQLQMVLV